MKISEEASIAQAFFKENNQRNMDNNNNKILSHCYTLIKV